jgi:steroid 3-oxidase
LTCAVGGALLAAAAWLLCFRLLPAVVVAVRLRWRPTKEEKAQVPPGSFGWPVVGETLDFVSCAYSPRPESFVDKRRLR